MKRLEVYYKVKDMDQEVKVSVGYELGGWGMLNGEYSRRGYYVYVQPVTRRDGMESFTLFDGFKMLLKEVKRQSKKAESEAIAEAQTMMRDLAEKMAMKKGWTLADVEPYVKGV